jgi:multiple sugar transport system permease protein
MSRDLAGSTVTTVTPAHSGDVAARHPRPTHLSRRSRTALTAYALISPLFVFLLLFGIYPLWRGFWISLHKWDLLGTDVTFIGSVNYRHLTADPVFWSSLWHTAYFAILSVPTLILSGLVLALLVRSVGWIPRVGRMVFYLPAVLSVSVASTIWLRVYDGQHGLLHNILSSLGVELSKSPLQSSFWAMPAIVLMTMWWTAGSNMMFFVAGLQDIPEEIYEAALLDGAGPLRRFVSVTLPGLRRTFTFVVIMQVVASLQVFGQVYILTGGGPIGSTRVLMQYVIEKSFRDFDVGYGAAMGCVLFAIMLILSMFQLRLFTRSEATP